MSDFQPAGDQPHAIKALCSGFKRGYHMQTLLGVTGSGKTYTMAKVIEQLQLPTLIISHNKTLAAQLFTEFKDFFPNNAVEYFVSYYDYYQPEAYVPARDLYIEKDSSVNDEIDRLRLAATASLVTRSDVIIVASVSCIYGLGTPEEYAQSMLILYTHQHYDFDTILEHLVRIQYERNDIALSRGKFRVLGDILEIYPAYRDCIVRIEFFGDEIEQITIVHPISGTVQEKPDRFVIYPARHFVMPQENINAAIADITMELEQQYKILSDNHKLVEAQRLKSRTEYDIEMLREMGYCNGIENYSRHLSRRAPGSRPAVLIDYFPDDFLTIIDESHATIPQIRAMSNGDRNRKMTLIEHGFRLPSALDNRPLYWDEFTALTKVCLCTSATPADYEYAHSEAIVEQIIRPTGLLDPKIIVRPARGQVDDVIKEIRIRINAQQRVLITTLTKKMAEDLTHYLKDLAISVQYLHSDVETIDRIEILRDLRKGKYDVIVGINLLREGLDLPEVSLVAILDADKEGFLRSERSLIQTAGRAARHSDGTVILYADTITDSITKTINETARRRKIQAAYNTQHGITPQSITKTINDYIRHDETEYDKLDAMYSTIKKDIARRHSHLSDEEYVLLYCAALRKKMLEYARSLEFEKAAHIRDTLQTLESPHSSAGKNKNAAADTGTV